MPLVPLPPEPFLAWAPALPPQPPQPPQPRQQPQTRVEVGVPRGTAEELYSRAGELIDQRRYERAIEYLDRVATLPNTTRADAALHWKAYAQWKLDQRPEALATLADMRKRFPESRWGKDAEALEVEIRQSSGQSVSPDGQASEELKLLALRGLMHSDPERALPMIEQILSGASTVKVKENALFVLSQSRSARAREIIVGAAKGNLNPDLQLRAVRYIGAMGGAENRQALDEVYRSTTDVAVKRAVIRSLGATGDRQRLLGLAKTESSPELRGEAVRSLGAMNASTELDELYQRESSKEVKGQILRAMVAGGNVASLSRLAASEQDPDLRRTAIRNLGALGSTRSGETLRSIYTSDANAEVKTEVINALAIQQNAAILVALARAEKDAALKRQIVERLSAMRSKEAADYLLELLR
jgi:HEAT repeat protein